MENFWRNAGVQLGKQWKVVALAVIVITGVLAIGLTKTEFATGQESYLNQDSQVALDNENYQNTFGGETIILLFVAEGDTRIEDLYTGKNLAEIERVRAELRKIPNVYASVDPLTTVEFSSNLLEGGTAGVAGQALLSGITRDTEKGAVRTTDAGLSTGRLGQVSDDAKKIGDEGWNELLIYDNTGFTTAEDGTVVAPQDPEERRIRKSLQGVFPNQQTAVGGVLVTGNADLDVLSTTTDEVIAVLDTLDLDGFELTVTGAPLYLQEINNYLQGGMLTLGLAALVVMTIILLVMFRVRWRLLPLLAVLIGVAWAFSLLGYMGLDLSLVTISGLPILIGLGIDFAIQIHNRVEEEVVLDHADHPISETLANVAPALIAATLAGVVAFLSMQVSQVPMIRDFGILLAVGVVVLVIVGIIVPTAALGIREYTRPTGERKVSLVEKITVKMGSLPSRLGAVFVALAVGVFVLGVLVEGNIKIESDPLKWISQDSENVENIDYLEEKTGFASTLGVLVEANNIAAPEVNGVLFDFYKSAEQRDDVVSASALVSTMGKVIDIDGATPLVPTSDDIERAMEVAPEDIQKALFNSDGTATQVNLRLAAASLDERAVLVKELQADLDELIAEADIPEDSILLVEKTRDSAIRATPSGLAVVGTGLLENLTANRAVLTYLALAFVALFLLLRFRSLARTLVTLVPVGIAVGLSSIVIGVSGLSLSPMTTVSGPLVIASSAEFCVLIMARYIEERQRGLEPEEASATSAGRTGRAFFTSAATTIGGFAVLIGSALPLLRDFGVIVTLNVAIALVAALVVMPPLTVWADGLGVLDTETDPDEGAVRLAAPARGKTLVSTIAGGVAVAVVIGIILAAAETESGATQAASYAAVELPTTTVAPPPDTPPPGETPGGGGEAVDVSQYPSEAPTQGTVAPILFTALTNQGVDPQAANCVIDLTTEAVDGDLDAQLGTFAAFTREALAPVVDAATRCGIDDATIDATIAAGPP